MGIGKDYFHLLRTHGGIAGDYLQIIESEFAAANGVVYTPPEENNEVFRRVNAARTIQLLAQCPLIVTTFQTTDTVIRLPANTVTDTTNDSGDGRIFIFRNSGTGNVTIKDYLGTVIVVLSQSSNILVYGVGVNEWDVIQTGSSTIKSGTVLAGSFTGNPKTYAVVFTDPFSSDNYSVTVTGQDARSWTVPDSTRSSTGFTISANANQVLTGSVHWQAVFNG